MLLLWIYSILYYNIQYKKLFYVKYNFMLNLFCDLHKQGSHAVFDRFEGFIVLMNHFLEYIESWRIISRSEGNKNRQTRLQGHI